MRVLRPGEIPFAYGPGSALLDQQPHAVWLADVGANEACIRPKLTALLVVA
jgi:hypothetical protein